MLHAVNTIIEAHKQIGHLTSWVAKGNLLWSDLNRSESRDLIFIPVPDVVAYFMPLTPGLGRLRPEGSESKPD